MRALATPYILGWLCLALSLSLCATENKSKAQTIAEFADYMADKHQFDPEFIVSTLQPVNINQSILEKIARPWEAKPWHQYFPIFLTEKRLNAGLKFWQEHQATLSKAQTETGVPAEIIVAIIGVETLYGTYKGNYPVLEALYTLGFHYPPRAKFFKSELEEYFLLTREEGFALPEVKGSYAGAMGWGQFISSSYRHYAVDFDGDGVRDLLNNPVDAIGSVANYFKRHGWQAEQPVAFPASIVDQTSVSEFTSKSLKYKHQWSELENAGVALDSQIQLADSQSVKLLAFEQPEHSEYWVGLPNFYVITRYNHSPLYAMAVYQFSQQLKQSFTAK